MRRHGVDAAVIFADIMTPVVAMGVEVELVEGVGPVVAEPVRSAAAVERLRVPDPAETLAPVLEAIGLVRARARGPSRPSSASAAARSPSPATSSRGGPRATSRVTKALMYREPAVWHGAARQARRRPSPPTPLAQARGGRRRRPALRLLGRARSRPADYAEFVAPWSGAGPRRAARGRACPTIHFGTGAATLLRAMAAAGGDVIGLDWRIPLDDGLGARRRATGPSRATSTRRCCSGPGSASRRRRATCSRAPAGGPGHIFNLGHGVLPGTDPDVLGRLVELVHAETAAPAPVTGRGAHDRLAFPV